MLQMICFSPKKAPERATLEVNPVSRIWPTKPSCGTHQLHPELSWHVFLQQLSVWLYEPKRRLIWCQNRAVWNLGSLQDHGNQTAKDKTGMGFGVQSSWISLQPPQWTKIWKRSSIDFTKSPSSLHLLHPGPSHSETSTYGCAPFSAHVSVTLIVSVPLLLCLLPLSVLPHVYVSFPCVSCSLPLSLTQNSLLQGTEVLTILYQTASPCQP